MSVDDLLLRIANLLATCGEPDWANSFNSFRIDFRSDPESAKRKIRSVYGGMGSFNDIVLHRPNGIPLRDENSELDHLRLELFEQCQ
jgi:uncharacterized protein DUF6966